MKEMGYTQVFSMTKGINGWKDAGYEITSDSELTPNQLTRYSRHILLHEVGVEGQIRLLKSKVLLVGAGGLGSPAGLYLAAAGVGTLGIIDSDLVDLTNLQRQILHSTYDVGRPKTESAKDAIGLINPDVKVITFQERLTSENAIEIFKDFDIILDGSDNFPTKYLVNDASFFTGKPYIYGGVFQFEGQPSVFFLRGRSLFALSAFPELTTRFGPQLRRGWCPGSCARANWIDSGHRGNQTHIKKRETLNRSILDLPFLGNGIPEISDPERPLMSSLQ
jgi:molybdopterin/thiamine biosynthesis adenylyltransferase